MVAGSIGGLGVVVPARSQSPTDPVIVELLSVDTSGVSFVAERATSPSISDAGGVVAFEAAEPGEEPRVWIRDRAAETTRAVAEDMSNVPGISGNGCIVAYVAMIGTASQLTVVDRCAAPAESQLPVGTQVDSIEGVAPSAPAVAFDGTTIAWSTGTEIRRYTLTPGADAWSPTHAFDIAPVADETSVTGARVDISADGATVAFTAGPGPAPYEPAPSNVYVWELDADGVATVEALSVTADGVPGTAASSSPSISADASTVVFETMSADLAVLGGVPLSTSLVVAVDRDDRSSGVVVEDATRPSVSADGEHLVYERGGALRVASSSDRWATSTDRGVDELAGAAPLSPASLTQHGRWIAFDSSALPAAGSTDAQVWLADLRSADATTIDSTVAPTTTAAPSTTEPATPPTVPTTTAPTTTAPPTTTTAPPTSAPGRVTDASANVPVRTTFPRVSLPRTTFRPTFTPSQTTFGGFLPPIDSRPVATALAFEPTVVGAGRRTGTVTLTATSSIDVVSVTAEPPGPFAVTQDGCSGRVNGSCTVEVQFAPTAIGPATASATFRLSDGSVVSARLDGNGTPKPTLDVVPGVAGAGQTVTVFGAGFPSGTTVGLLRGADPVADEVVVDADGTFAHVIVVLPNSPTGPMALVVDGVVDVFDATSADVLVSTRGSGSSDAALRGSASSLAGS